MLLPPTSAGNVEPRTSEAVPRVGPSGSSPPSGLPDPCGHAIVNPLAMSMRRSPRIARQQGRGNLAITQASSGSLKVLPSVPPPSASVALVTLFAELARSPLPGIAVLVTLLTSAKHLGVTRAIGRGTRNSKIRALGHWRAAVEHSGLLLTDMAVITHWLCLGAAVADGPKRSLFPAPALSRTPL